MEGEERGIGWHNCSRRVGQQLEVHVDEIETEPLLPGLDSRACIGRGLSEA
jgi:hypothetical protein